MRKEDELNEVTGGEGNIDVLIQRHTELFVCDVTPLVDQCIGDISLISPVAIKERFIDK